MSVVISKSRWRGLKEAMERLGDITGEIDRRLAEGREVRVLEIGCGNGMALMDLSCLYGDRVSFEGINKLPEHGETDSTKEIAVRLGRHTAEQMDAVPAPRIHYFDASDPWPMEDESFDVIYSQHAFMWIQDKVNALQETNRVLKSDGIALLDLQFKRRGSVYRNAIVVRDQEREIPFWDVAKQHLSVESQQRESSGSLFHRIRRWAKRLLGLRDSGGRGRAQWLMRKVPNLNFGLELCETVQFGSAVLPGRKGVQSVYRVKK